MKIPIRVIASILACYEQWGPTRILGLCLSALSAVRLDILCKSLRNRSAVRTQHVKTFYFSLTFRNFMLILLKHCWWLVVTLSKMCI